MLDRWTPLTDLDFILAHKVLQDPKYARHFLHRPKGRELILDNSTHEFGKPLPLSDLHTAAELVNADMLIAPDIVNETMSLEQYRLNIQWMQDTIMEFAGTKTLIAGVLCGHSKRHRDEYLDQTGLLDVLCFTFHDSHRLTWYHDFEQHDSFHTFKRVHVLGVSSLDEMERWYEISERYPGCDMSIDTTKAVKWGAQGKKIDTLKSLRGGPIDAKAVLELDTFSEEQIQCVEYNIEVLKKVCTGQPWRQDASRLDT